MSTRSESVARMAEVIERHSWYGERTRDCACFMAYAPESVYEEPDNG